MKDRKATNPWLVCWRPLPDAEMRLFCLPHAGASGSIYRDWQAGLPDWLEVCPVELPGRWARRRETLFTRLPPLVEAVAEGIAAMLDRPFAIFGHSLGALLGFELTRHLRRDGRPEPVHLFASAMRAPQLIPPAAFQPIHQLPDAVFLTQMVKHYNGMPAAVLQDPELLELVLPPTRADVEVVETYEYRHEAPLECPISVFHGSQDRTQRVEELRPWKEQSTRAVEWVEFEGGHFFLDGARSRLLASISAALGEHRLASSPPSRVASGG